MDINKLLADYKTVESELNGLLSQNGTFISKYNEYKNANLYTSFNTPTGAYKFNGTEADISGVSIEECMKYVSSTGGDEVGVVSTAGDKYLCLKGSSVNKTLGPVKQTVIWEMNATDNYYKPGNMLTLLDGAFKLQLSGDSTYLWEAIGVPDKCRGIQGFGGYVKTYVNDGTLKKVYLTDYNIKNDTDLHDIFGECLNSPSCVVTGKKGLVYNGTYKCDSDPNESRGQFYNTNNDVLRDISGTTINMSCISNVTNCNKNGYLKLDNNTGKPYITLYNQQYDFGDKFNYANVPSNILVNDDWKDKIIHKLEPGKPAKSISSDNGKWLMSVDENGVLNISVTEKESPQNTVEIYPIPGWIKTRYSVMEEDDKIMGKINQLYEIVGKLISARDEQNADYIHNKVEIDTAID